MSERDLHDALQVSWCKIAITLIDRSIGSNSPVLSSLSTGFGP